MNLLLSLLARPRVLLAGAAVIAITGAVLYWRHAERQDAVDDALDHIEEINRDAIDAAVAASLGRAECQSTRGLFWDFAASQCRRTAGGPR